MAGESTSPNMNLVLPGVGQTSGPDYANDLNASLTIIDQHNHSSGSGVQITPAGLNINADLSILNNNLINSRSLRFTAQGSPLALGTDLNCAYVSGVDLYYNDGNGNQVRLTQSGGVAGSPGSIASLSSPASATYVAGSQTFVWQSAANTPANLDAASILLRNLTANSKSLTLNPPAAMGANYSLTLPALPGSTQIMALDASGNMSAPYSVDNSTIAITANVIGVKSLGITASQIANTTITATQIANSTITGTQVASNINLPGNAAQENGKNIVVQNTNTTTSLCIIRGTVAANGTVANGEGFSSSYAGSGNYNITFTSAFSDTPVVVTTGFNSPSTSCTAVISSLSSSGVTVSTRNAGGGGTAIQSEFCFIAIGQR